MEENKYDGILRKALAINDIPNDFNPNNVPTTGEEYIHYVMYEAQHCEEWTKSNIPKEKLKKPTKTIEQLSGCVSCPREFLPSTTWQQKQIADFSSFRLHIQKIKQQRNEPKVRQFNGESIQWQLKCSNPPQLSELLVLSQKSLYKILDFMLEWMDDIPDGKSITYANGAWLYAILSSLEFPLMPEHCSTLRDVARKCSEIRSKLQTDASEECYVPLNLFICIIAQYYNNYDLIDL